MTVDCDLSKFMLCLHCQVIDKQNRNTDLKIFCALLNNFSILEKVKKKTDTPFLSVAVS